MREHTQVYRLANYPRRSFTWLGAKKDESPQGFIAVGAAPVWVPQVVLKQKKALYNNYSHILPRTKRGYIFNTLTPIQRHSYIITPPSIIAESRVYSLTPQNVIYTTVN